MTDRLEVTVLGCGSSGGVPRIGGPGGQGYWGACDPSNPKNRRRRCSILVQRHAEAGTSTVLVDTSPDMREQLIDARISQLDAVLITHDHADQLHGLDDLRMVAMNMRRRVDVFSDAASFAGVMARFGYCFVQPTGSDYPPILNAHQIAEPFAPFALGGAALDERAFTALAGVECWIVDALRYTPHPSHSHVARTLEWIERVKPKRAILTNLHVDLDYETLRRELPPTVEPAYDGMTISVDL